LEIGQAFLKASDVGRIVCQCVIREANPTAAIGMEKLFDRLLGKAKIGESFAIGLADELICALHQTLPLLEPLDPIDQLFGCVGIVAEDGAVRFRAAVRRR
jgi:hypothetical protein